MFNAISRVFGSLLGVIFNIVGDFGFSIIILTIIIKLILIPLSISQIKQTKKMGEIQPKLKALQDKYKNDKEALNKKTMELYAEHKMNPLSGCLPLLIQMPILFGLFGTLRNPELFVFAGDANLTAQALGQGFFWVSNLADPDLLGNVIKTSSGLIASLPGVLPIVSAVTTYIQMATQQGTQQNSQMKTMAMTMPIIILMMGRTLPGGLILYWTVSNIFQLVQQNLINKLTGEESKKDVLN